jgi:hypothetical protein
MSSQSPSNEPGEAPLTNITSGCLYAAYVVGLSAGLLFLNALFCLSVYGLLPFSENDPMSSRIGQLFFFIVPLLMLIVEWNLLDRLRRLLRLDSQPSDRSEN